MFCRWQKADFEIVFICHWRFSSESIATWSIVSSIKSWNSVLTLDFSSLGPKLALLWCCMKNLQPSIKFTSNLFTRTSSRAALYLAPNMHQSTLTSFLNSIQSDFTGNQTFSFTLNQQESWCFLAMGSDKNNAYQHRFITGGNLLHAELVFIQSAAAVCNPITAWKRACRFYENYGCSESQHHNAFYNKAKVIT